MAKNINNMSVAILAGGLATRLHPITEKIPKLLVDVAGEPFFNHQLRLLRSAGLNHIVLCLGYLGEQVVDIYGNGANWDVEIDYSFDGPNLLGTGGALMKALPKLGENFYVLYGDSYLPINYMEIGKAFYQSGKKGLMTIYKNSGLYDVSNVWFENRDIRSYDKTRKNPLMQHIDYGLSAFQNQAFSGFSLESKFDLSDVQTALVKENQMVGIEIFERFYEVGSHAGLQELNALISTKIK
jgi:NDP-sugar pyrophosphorylase family protein